MLSDIGPNHDFPSRNTVGLVNYYRMAHNIHALSKVGWVTKASLLKTLARKVQHLSLKD